MEKQATVLAFAAAHGIDLSPLEAENCTRMLLSVMHAAEAARTVHGDGFFEAEPADFLVYLQRFAGK